MVVGTKFDMSIDMGLLRYMSPPSLVLAVYIIFTCSASFGESRGLHRLADSLFDRIGRNAIFDFTLPENLTRSLHFNTHQALSIDEVERLSSEFVWGGRWAKYYYSSPTVNRYQSRDSFRVLVQIMKEQNVTSINLRDLREIAIQEIERLKKEGLVGEFYIIRTIEKPLAPANRTITLSLEVQHSIDKLFSEGSLVRTLPLSDLEKAFEYESRLTVEEIHELRAIRLASEVFEKNTVLKNDSAGGLISNFRAELFGKFQQICCEEAATYEYFLQTLFRRGLQKHFAPSGQISMRPRLFQDPAQVGHVAAKLISRKSSEVLVVDGWYEKGGEAAHVLFESDWRKLPIRSLRADKIRDAVQLTPYPFGPQATRNRCAEALFSAPAK